MNNPGDNVHGFFTEYQITDTGPPHNSTPIVSHKKNGAHQTVVHPFAIHGDKCVKLADTCKIIMSFKGEEPPFVMPNMAGKPMGDTGLEPVTSTM